MESIVVKIITDSVTVDQLKSIRDIFKENTFRLSYSVSNKTIAEPINVFPVPALLADEMVYLKAIYDDIISNNSETLCINIKELKETYFKKSKMQSSAVKYFFIELGLEYLNGRYSKWHNNYRMVVKDKKGSYFEIPRDLLAETLAELLENNQK